MGNGANGGSGNTENNQGEPGVPSGGQGDRGSDSEEPELFGNPTKRKNSGRGDNIGSKRGDDNKRNAKTGGEGTSNDDSSRKGSTDRLKRIVKQTRQELKAERDDILKALSAAFEEGHKKGARRAVARPYLWC